MPAPLATAETLRRFLDLTTIDTERADLLLSLASGEVRGFCGQLFDFVEADVVILDGKGATVLLLPELPVASVEEIIEAPGFLMERELAGPTASSPAFEWNEDGIVRRIDGGVFDRRLRYYRVTYSHGWSTVPDEVMNVVLRVAARSYDNPQALRQETLGRYSYTIAGDQAGVGLFDADTRALADYRVGGRGRSGTSSSGS